MAALLCSAPFLMGQDVQTGLHSHTSSTATSAVGNHVVTHDVGNPFSAPVLLAGDDVVLHGLFALLYGRANGATGVKTIFADDKNVTLEYDEARKCIKLSNPAPGKLIVLNSGGVAVVSVPVDAGATSETVSNLTPGLYLAGFTTSNQIKKSIKFIVK